jgi:hypothetical protein
VSRITLRRDQVESFDHYPFALPAVRTLEQLELHPKMTYFIGENGSMKTRRAGLPSSTPMAASRCTSNRTANPSSHS